MSKVVVLTSAMLRVEVEATHWVTEPMRSGEVLQYRVRLYKAGDTQPVAEFEEIHAVWHKDKGELIEAGVADDED